jgi:hypothetical protein
MFSDTIRVRDQVLLPYRAIGKTVVLCTVSFTFLDIRWEDERF